MNYAGSTLRLGDVRKKLEERRDRTRETRDRTRERSSQEVKDRLGQDLGQFEAL